MLERAAEALDAWKVRVQEHSSARMTLEGLEKLLEDAATLAVIATELPAVSTTVTTAQKWITQVRGFPSWMNWFSSQFRLEQAVAALVTGFPVCHCNVRTLNTDIATELFWVCCLALFLHVSPIMKYALSV